MTNGFSLWHRLCLVKKVIFGGDICRILVTFGGALLFENVENGCKKNYVETISSWGETEIER